MDSQEEQFLTKAFKDFMFDPFKSRYGACPESILDRVAGRRAFLQTLAGLGLAGCGVSPTLDLFGKTVAGRPRTDSGYPLSLSGIAALPAALGVRIGGGAPEVLRLIAAQDEDLHWISAEQLVLVTRRGRLVRTVGLRRDLRATTYASADPLPQVYATGLTAEAPKIWYYMDVTAKDDFGVVVETSYTVLGPDTTPILGVSREVTRIREHLRVPSWRWATDNLYWIDRATGSICKSRQQYCPEVAPITCEFLKLPAAANTVNEGA